MPRRISFINYKGGVGKTSLIVNVAASLAEMGKRVLLVDLDVQSNSSMWLLRLERWNPIHQNNKGHIYTIFEPGKDRLKDCVVRDVVRGAQIDGPCPLPGLDLLPTTFNLVDLEEKEFHADAMPPYADFQEQLAEIEDDYDFILFDCPPNILRASSCGVFSSNEIYVPANPDALSLIGLTLLVNKMEAFYSACDCYRVPEMGPRAEVMGIVFNSIKANTDIQSAKMRMQVRLNQFKGNGYVSKDVRILSETVRDEVVVPRSVTLGMPVCLVGKTDNREKTVRDDYHAVAKAIVDSPRRDVGEASDEQAPQAAFG